MGDIAQLGFNMAFPAVFLVLVRSMLRGFQAAKPCLVSLTVAIITYLLFPNGGWYVLIGSISGLIYAYFIPSPKHHIEREYS